jgi:drug/metabolite transporter (DMT)-like permease
MWIMYSILAAVLWGLDYALVEKVLHKISFSTLLSIEFFFGFCVMLGLSLASGSYDVDLPAILNSKNILGYVVLIVVVFTIAHVFIVLSIGSRNATLAGLIEMSYPLFIAGFSWLLFKEATLNLGTSLGGTLIVLGILSIYCFNQ